MPNIEEVIKRAIEQGDFDNLPGSGKPLKLDENPHEHPSWRTAYRLLKNSGFSLPWIETLKEIETDLELARGELVRAFKLFQPAHSFPGCQDGLEQEWHRAVDTFRERITTINQRIGTYNLEVPSERFQRSKLNVEREIDQVTRIP